MHFTRTDRSSSGPWKVTMPFRLQSTWVKWYQTVHLIVSWLAFDSSLTNTECKLQLRIDCVKGQQLVLLALAEEERTTFHCFVEQANRSMTLLTTSVANFVSFLVLCCFYSKITEREAGRFPSDVQQRAWSQTVRSMGPDRHPEHIFSRLHLDSYVTHLRYQKKSMLVAKTNHSVPSGSKSRRSTIDWMITVISRQMRYVNQFSLSTDDLSRLFNEPSRSRVKGPLAKWLHTIGRDLWIMSITTWNTRKIQTNTRKDRRRNDSRQQMDQINSRRSSFLFLVVSFKVLADFSWNWHPTVIS